MKFPLISALALASSVVVPGAAMEQNQVQDRDRLEDCIIQDRDKD